MEIDPSVHSVHQSIQCVTDGMDGQSLVEVGFVRPKKQDMDVFYGQTDIGGGKP